MATRSLAARWPQWIALGFVVGAAVLADQVTKHIVAGQLALDDSVHVLGPFSIHHVQNSGIAFGLFASATGSTGWREPERAKKTSIQPTASAVSAVTSAVAFANKPKAIPEFWT